MILCPLTGSEGIAAFDPSTGVVFYTFRDLRTLYKSGLFSNIIPLLIFRERIRVKRVISASSGKTSEKFESSPQVWFTV